MALGSGILDSSHLAIHGELVRKWQCLQCLGPWGITSGAADPFDAQTAQTKTRGARFGPKRRAVLPFAGSFSSRLEDSRVPGAGRHVLPAGL